MNNKLYKIHYLSHNIIQYKVLISHQDYLATKLLSEGQQKKQLKYLSKGIEWFTDKSALFEAINTGILDCNGYHYPVKIELTNNISLYGKETEEN